MKKRMAILMALLFILCMFTGCNTQKEEEKTITEDLTLEVLEKVLKEKGDDLLLTDFPETVFVMPTVIAGVPHMLYPITDNMTFTVLPGPDGKNKFYLSVSTESEGDRQYSGSAEILAYLETQR